MLASAPVVNYTPGPAFTFPTMGDVNRRARGFGQGKTATTILGEQGHIVTVITDVPYVTRSRHVPVRPGKGTRAMHRSTLTIPTQPDTDYTTTVKANFGGSKSLKPGEVPRQYPSQHITQFMLGRDPQSQWETRYQQTFYGKGAQPYYKIHMPTFINKMNMNEGKEVRRVMTAPEPGNNYWTQYNRIHNKLGAMLGPGVAREYPVRPQYNVLTGEKGGPAWKEDNRRTSGNRVLYHGYRSDAQESFILG